MNGRFKVSQVKKQLYPKSEVVSDNIMIVEMNRVKIILLLNLECNINRIR